MRIFLTGATGFIGTAVIPELLAAGHTVLGLSRSEAGDQTIRAIGADVHRGELEDTASLKSGTENADAVIHCGFIHDFSQFLRNCEIDRAAISAMAEVLSGSQRPLLMTSGCGIGSHPDGKPATEDHLDTSHPNPRTASELLGMDLLDRGVNLSVMRLPQVHNTVKQGLVPYFTAFARQKGVSAYVGDGSNRLAAGHVSDVALLYRLAIERGIPGERFHAVDEEGVSVKEISETLARGLKIPTQSVPPEEAMNFFGPLGMFANLDMPASSKITRERTGWSPKGPGLIEDLNNMDYSKA